MYAIQVDTDTSDAEVERLRQQVSNGQITGFLWLSDQALEDHKIIYSTKEAADFGQSVEIRNAVRTAVTKQRLSQKGMNEPEIDTMLTPIKLKTLRIENGHEGTSGTMVFFTAFAMVMLLYSVVLIYGIAVMRSVIEEKNTRILEVLLSAVTSKATAGRQDPRRRRGGPDANSGMGDLRHCCSRCRDCWQRKLVSRRSTHPGGGYDRVRDFLPAGLSALQFDVRGHRLHGQYRP